MERKRTTKPRTPREQGLDFEEEFGSALGGVNPQPGSGNQWFARMDLDDLHVLWSLKHTSKKGFRFTPDLIREVVDAVEAPGGKGGLIIPGLAISVGGEVFTAMRASDQLKLLTTDEKYITPTKSEAKRNASRVPQLLREEEDG